MSTVNKNQDGLYYRQDGDLIFFYNNAEHRFYCTKSSDIGNTELSNKFLGIPHNPLSISWLLEPSCNLDCLYCFADDCLGQKKTDNIEETVNAILSLNPLVLMMSGGEPTLNSDLEKIMNLVYGRCGMVLDTNGTMLLKKKSLMEAIKKYNVLVRITVDSFDDGILSMTRPSKKRMENMGRLLHDTVETLVDNQIEFAVHTVITRYNYNNIPLLAEELKKLNVKRWLVYTVVPSKKMGERYNEIAVKAWEVDDLRHRLNLQLADSGMRVSVSNDSGKNTKTNIMVDSTGAFFTDSYINPNKEKLCKDNLAPDIREITSVIDMHDHATMYLKL